MTGQWQYGTYSYGNERILPLIGGSGGNGSQYNGGGGGGAILIAAISNITVNGSCHANGGGTVSGTYAGGGSGGAIRLVANQILGSGSIRAASDNNVGGRIRVEANGPLSPQLNIFPNTIAVTPDSPATIWPGSDAPKVEVTSVAALNTPSDPTAGLLASGADLVIGNTNAVVVKVQTSNFPTNGVVTVYFKPKNGDPFTRTAAFQSGNTNTAIWHVTNALPVNHTVIQARGVAN